MTTIDSLQTQINSVIALYSNGQIQEAIDSVEMLTKGYPDEPLLYNISGVCYKASGQLDAAVESFEKALAIDPDYIEAYYNLGIVFMDLGQLDEAVKSYEKALTLKPNYAKAHYNLGIAFKKLGQLDAAVECYEKAIVIQPGYTEAHNNLGNALKDLGQLDAAIEYYKKALSFKPDYAEAHNNLGIAFKQLGQLDAAIKSYERLLALKPDDAETHNNLGIVYMQLNQTDVALKCYEKALTLKPNYADAHANRGNVMKRFKHMDEALASYKSAIALDPELVFILGDIYVTKMRLCIWDGLESHLKELTSKVNNGEKALNPFIALALIDDPEIQRKAAEIYANEKYPQSHVLPKIERYQKHKKIRIGYFSQDFRNHPVAGLTAELYEMHDRERFEIHAFSFGPDTNDEMNLRIKQGVDHYHDVRTMSHKDVAMLARSLEIDIAVDLGGFTGYSRTEIFALSAAPIQI
ncbi:MAG: tetratricopeptide repeat protein, partial [Gammaproteobacteria bacterium]|nr:tetratricopeptide repeat protein [Gammaproteobacteria bacterium]